MTTADNRAACAASIPSAGFHETGRSTAVSLEPASAYEAVTRQMVLALDEDLKEIKSRLNSLLFMVAGSLLLDLALRLATGS